MARHAGAAAITGWVFAATMMIIIGVFQIIDGIVAIAEDNFYLTVRNYTFNLDTTTWGWIHLVLGAVVLLTGIALMSGRTWAAVTGIVLAGLSAINNFFFLPYYPVWAIVTIAGCVFIIWSLARILNVAAGSEPDRWSPMATRPVEQRWPQATGTGRSRTDVKAPATEADEATPGTGGQHTGQQGTAP